MQVTKSIDFHGRVYELETGNLAKQADGSVIVKAGESFVLVTAVSGEMQENPEFFPLTVDYFLKDSAAGRIPGGYFKREGRPSESEVLIGRFVDRTIRPLFPEWYTAETQVVATVLSGDSDNEPDVMAITGASAALCISDIPFNGPVAGVRVIRTGGKFYINPPQI